MRKWVIVVLAAMCTASGVVLGADVGVPPVTPGEFADAGPEAHWIWTLLASEVVAIVAGWAFMQIAGRIRDERTAAAVTAIKDAVSACYQEYVREIKAARADGRLTLEEKNEALNRAYRAAMEYARSEGVDLLKVFAKATVLRLIEHYVGESKLRAVPPPLPDLAP